MALIKLNNRGVKDATAFGSISSLGELTFISKQTASSSATIDFTSGIDSTYKEYIFYFNNIHPATDNTALSFQGNASGGSGYNETITSTFFQANHSEDGSGGSLGYRTSEDQAQGTAFQQLGYGVGNGNDECASGYLHLFNPSSTTFVKHFISRVQVYHKSDISYDMYSAGYFNTTSAIDEIQFKMSSGNIDSGDILLFGLN
jgi:hypothetical protein